MCQRIKSLHLLGRREEGGSGSGEPRGKGEKRGNREKGDTGRKRRKKDKGNERVGFGEKLN